MTSHQDPGIGLAPGLDQPQRVRFLTPRVNPLRAAQTQGPHSGPHPSTPSDQQEPRTVSPVNPTHHNPLPHPRTHSPATATAPNPAGPSTGVHVLAIDERAAPVAVGHADSTARRGRAVAITLLVATQRPTQQAMGSGAVRSQMDVRLCLRVRERRDVDLVLGQGMLAAGWHAHPFDAPDEFLVSTPGHTAPRRARAYLLTGTGVTTLATRPALDDTSRAATDSTTRDADQQLIVPRPRHSDETLAEPGPANGEDPDTALLSALRQAPPEGCSVPDLMAATGMRRTWVDDRPQHHATGGRAVQVARGRWRASHPEP
jgi:DNA segregation ATPase FtsK/SpoIIIE, S-DNA-T family